MSSTTPVAVVFSTMILAIVLLIGIYLATREEDGDGDGDGGGGFASRACNGSVSNGYYELDQDGNCRLLGCKLGYYPQDGACSRLQDGFEDSPNVDAVDCTLGGYTYGECEPKLNQTCGQGAGTQLKTPIITEAAIGLGSCETASYVDCDIECPDVCRVPDGQYTSLEGCKASTTEGESVKLGAESGYCGQGVEVREIFRENISPDVIEAAGFQNVDDYLEYANPNGVCPTQISTVCEVECKDGLLDVGCDYGKRQYEYIKDASGAAICFNKTQAEDYIAGDRAERPDKLDTILAADVREADGTYDVVGNVSKKNRKGLYIQYLSDQGMSYDNISKNDCTLFKTEECDAPREKVDCVVGELSRSACQFVGCGKNEFKTVTQGVITHPFGDGDACRTDYQATYNTTDNCNASKRCCEPDDYKLTGDCPSNGIGTYTLDTTVCNRTTETGYISPLTEERSCTPKIEPKDCQVSAWQDYSTSDERGRCTKTCGGGTKLQFRRITQNPVGTGAACPVLEQEVDCNTHPCPVNCAGYWDKSACTMVNRSGGGPGPTKEPSGSKVYKVTQARVGTGLDCDYADGTTGSCERGDAQ